MPPGKSPFAVQEKIRQVYYDKVLARLDGLFSELVSGDVIIRFDRLDLDLGSVDGEKLEQELVEKVLHIAREVLKEKLQFQAGENQDMEVIPVHRSNTDLVLYFLEYGRLPWWSRVEDLRQLESGIMAGGPAPAGFRIKFRALMEEVSVARKRLLFQFSEDFFQFILSACFPDRTSGSPEDNVAWFKNFYGDEEDLKTYEGSGKTNQHSGKKEKAPGGADTGTSAEDAAGRDRSAEISANASAPANEESLTNTKTSINTDTSIENTERGTGKATDGQAPAEKNPAKPGGEGRAASPEERAGGMADDKTTHPAATGTTDGYPSPGVPRPELSSPGESAFPSQKGYPEKNRDDINSDGNGSRAPDRRRTAEGPLSENRYSGIRKDDNEPVYTELAGLVILYPFLSDFFTALHLMEGKSFRDEGARHKAVHLLGYLATGAAEIQEHRLVFPKLLCGMSLANPVERMGVITEEEMEESEQLLDTVITYWKVLKSTSADGLRDSFLQRVGKLSRKDDGWQLDVEKRTLDILLGKLPWGFSIIKLPWMTEMIFVNWG